MTTPSTTAAGGARPKIRAEIAKLLRDSMAHDSAAIGDLNPQPGAAALRDLEATRSERHRSVDDQLAEAERKLQRQQRRVDQLLASRTFSRDDPGPGAGTSLAGNGGRSHRRGILRPSRDADNGVPHSLRTPLARSTPILFPEDEVGEQMTGLETRADPADVAPQRETLPKKPDLPLPKYQVGEDWNDFLTEWCQNARMVRLTTSQILPYLKHSLPAEARQLLTRKNIENINEAIEVLEDMYLPKRNAMSIFEELRKVSQKPDERMRNLASRLESVANKHIDALSTHMTREEVDNLVCTRFRQALLEEDTRNHLCWDHQREPMTLQQMVYAAQRFEDEKDDPSSVKSKRNLRTSDDDSEVKRLQAKVSELQKALRELKSAQSGDAKEAEQVKPLLPAERQPQTSRQYRPTRQSRQDREPRQPRRTAECWNCGEVGHFKRECQKPRQSYQQQPKQPKPEDPLN